MLSALLRKEWRQLRLLRWAGVGLGLLLPPLLLALAGASDRGWLFAAPTNSTSASVVREMLPLALAYALWPLLALMAASHALAADRADGTAAFLLERPVSRTRVWLARILAALGTTLTTVASHIAIWWILVWIVGDPASSNEAYWLRTMLVAGGIAVAVASLAGMAAAPFARTPIQAVLIGLVLTAVPVGVAALFVGGTFFHYRVGEVPLGPFLPLFLLIGYVVASFVMECRGEPAGRGRTRRGAAVLVAAFLAMPLFFAGSVPVVLRWDARLGLGNTTLIPARSGEGALVLNDWQRAAWLIDTESHRMSRFFAAPVYEAAWSHDGSRLALLHAAGAAGRFLPDPRLEVIDPAGTRRRSAIACPECRPWWGNGLFWVGDQVVTPGFANGRESVLILDTTTASRRVVDLPGPAHRWFLVEANAARAGEGLYVLRLLRRKDTGDGDGGAPQRGVRDAVLHRLDVANASLDAGIDVPNAGGGGDRDLRRSLSPSGSRWLRHPPPLDLDPERRTEVLELATGTTITLPTRHATWLSDDRLAWLEKRGESSFDLVVGPLGEGRRVRTLEGRWFKLDASPDLQRLLILANMTGEGWNPRRWVLEPESGRCDELPLAGDSWHGAVQWAGPDRLAVVEQGSLALLDPRNPAEPEYVIGGPRR